MPGNEQKWYYGDGMALQLYRPFLFSSYMSEKPFVSQIWVLLKIRKRQTVLDHDIIDMHLCCIMTIGELSGGFDKLLRERRGLNEKPDLLVFSRYYGN